MATGIASADLRYKIEVTKNAGTLKFTDLTDYSTVSSNYVAGLLKITNPAGDVIAENLGFSTDDYSTPDIFIAASNTTVEGVTLLLDVNDNIVTGQYDVEYKVQEVSVATTVTVGSVTASNTASSLVLVDANITQTIADDILASGGLILSGGVNNNGGFTLTGGSYDLATTTLTVTVEEDLTDETAAAAYSLATVDGSVFFTYSADKSFVYNYTSPVVSIDMSYDCDVSILTSVDETDYTCTSCASDVEPTTTTRTHSVTAPATVNGIGYGAISDVSTATRVIPANIYTGIWQTGISTIVQYDITEWDGANFFIIHDTITGSDNITVRCDRCSCDLRQCVINLYQEWLTYKDTNPFVGQQKEVALFKVLSLYMQYLQAEKCGVDSSSFCNSIADILKANNCDCNTTPDPASVEVIPITSSSAVASSILFGTGVPSSSLGIDTDMYIETTNYTIYYKEDGVWGSQGSIKGDTGDTGATGATGGIGESGTTLLASDLTASDNAEATNSEVVSITIDPSTDPSTGVAGDVVRIVSYVKIDNAETITSLEAKVRAVGEPDIVIYSDTSSENIVISAGGSTEYIELVTYVVLNAANSPATTKGSQGVQGLKMNSAKYALRTTATFVYGVFVDATVNTVTNIHTMATLLKA
jgi:hypothetical protein